MQHLDYTPTISIREIYKIFLKRWEEEILSEVKETENNRYKKAMIFFQFHYVFYLCGYDPNLEKVAVEFKALTTDVHFKQEDATAIFGEVEKFLIEREAYEALILFTKTNSEFLALPK
jgi:hypothetical protein